MDTSIEDIISKSIKLSIDMIRSTLDLTVIYKQINNESFIKQLLGYHDMVNEYTIVSDDDFEYYLDEDYHIVPLKPFDDILPNKELYLKLIEFLYINMDVKFGDITIKDQLNKLIELTLNKIINSNIMVYVLYIDINKESYFKQLLGYSDMVNEYVIIPKTELKYYEQLGYCIVDPKIFDDVLSDKELFITFMSYLYTNKN
jgi:hypothetical protein